MFAEEKPALLPLAVGQGSCDSRVQKTYVAGHPWDILKTSQPTEFLRAPETFRHLKAGRPRPGNFCTITILSIFEKSAFSCAERELPLIEIISWDLFGGQHATRSRQRIPCAAESRKLEGVGLLRQPG
jgi:hypothetical protein